MSRRLSMSKMGLALICSHSFRDGVPLAPREAGARARVGTHTHGLIDAKINGVRYKADDVNLEEFAEAKGLFDSAMKWIEPRRPRLLKCEVGVRSDTATDTAVWGPRRGQAGYDDHGPRILKGTLDLVLRGEDGVLEVVDVKTGKKEYASHAQLYAQAVGVSRIYREGRVRVGFLYPRKTKCDEPEWEELDEDRLDEEAGRISRVVRTLPMAEPVRGEHCWKCDANFMCKAFNATAA